MLSVLIPIYNFDVRSFIRELHDQALRLVVPVEIICLDDRSDQKYRTLHEELKTLPLVRWIDSATNLGRSAARNALVREAKFDHLLFLDCDGQLVREKYFERYLKLIPEYDVVYGGRVYSTYAPSNVSLYFHWLYGSQREAQAAPVRQANPYRSFMTNNFLARKEVFLQVGMDESIRTYGHEDTLFACGLMKAGYRVHHIDNPVGHLGLERADVFLQKSAEGVKNLARLIKTTEVAGFNRLAGVYQRLQRLALMAPIYWLMRPFERTILRNLQGRNPSLRLFDVWKLIRLHREMR